MTAIRRVSLQSAQGSAQIFFKSLMINNKKKNNLKTSKGYRLKDSTHSLIEKTQLLINGSKDTVISRAVRLYYNQISNDKTKSALGNKN